jgi:AbrB family looped-hinge helix DNA binding protein
MNYGIYTGMDVTITMDSAGRIVLPKTVRELLHLRGGARLTVNVSANKIELLPAPDAEVRVVRRGGRMVIVGAPKNVNALAAIEGDREDRDAQVISRARRPR